jgi:hypothetical protein
MTPRLLLTTWALIAALSGCATTTGALEGTSGSVGNTTEASTNLTSSTSPESNSDDQRKSTKADRNEIRLDEAIRFSENHFEELKQNAARGEGEYLEAVGTFLGVSSEKQSQFSSLVRKNFDSLFVAGNPSADVAVMRMNKVLNKNAKLRVN